MAKTGFFVNTTDFDQKFEKVIKNTIPSLAHKGLFNASNAAFTDTKNEQPYLPRDIGDLEGSWEVHKPSNLQDLFVEFGFNIIYAARLHEDGKPGWNWTRPGSGPKYLESKLIRNKDRYMKIVALTISNGQVSV